ncbi:MAG TPA: T9SS type A sorting domain-containing protein [Candidatus Cloacimonetes bacterium]|nr:T9SS type A sorting domain-containing protein [Candidatus Cloacimonadota bacterium]
MKKIIIPFLLFCFVFPNLFSDTYVSGNVSGTWNVAGSPYRVTANINVVASTTLTIEDNVQVIFEDDYLFTVNGTLEANNAEFSLLDPPPGGIYSWQGIEFTGSSANCIIDSCEFNNASPGIVFTNTNQSIYPSISNSTFNFLNHASAEADYALILTDDSEPTIDNNFFEGYIRGIYINANLSAAEPDITNNEFNLLGLRLTRQSHSKAGVFEGVSEVNLDNNEFLGFEKGLKVINTTETESSPRIANTRIRSSSRNSRQDETGVKIDGTVAVDIDNCDIEDYAYGIRYSGSGTVTRATPTITNSRVRNSTEPTRPRALIRGAFIDSLISLNIDSCLIVGYSSGIALLNTSSTTSSPRIANTRIRSSSRSRDTAVGLFMFGNMNSTIQENIFADCDSAVVISGEDTWSLLYKNNMFLTTGAIDNVAIHAEDSNNLDIYNNTIYAYDVGLDASLTNTDFQNNIVWHDSPTVEPVSFDAGVSVQYNDIARPGGQLYPGTGNLNADPLFVDPLSENFYLQWGSPCIDAGNPDIVFDDIDGTRGDIGAFFYCQGGPCPIVLSTFTAQFINSTPKLSWMTATETENRGWNIYRGEDETALQNDETLQINNLMIEGAGTTSEPTEYSFFDEFDFILNFTYWYWLESTSSSGETETYGPISLFIPENEDNPEAPDMPEKFGLLRNYPNPFNPITRISFKLPKEKYAELTIYNIKGEKINTLFKGQTSDDSPLNVYWDACDENGREVESGIYLYKLVSGDYVQTRKMIYLK